MTVDKLREYRKNTINRNVALQPGDLELLRWCVNYLGTSQSEVVRGAIRHYAVHLQQIARKGDV